jgi:type III secretory pathway component EscT
MSLALWPAEWVACALVLARLAPSGVALGVITRGALPSWLGLSLCLALAPALALGVDASPLLAGGALPLGASLVRELCLGSAFAVAVALPWLTLSYALRNVAGAGVIGADAASTLYLLAAAALCVALGAPRAYLEALASSLHEVPVGTISAGREAWLRETLSAVAAGLHATLALALPLWMALWLIDATLLLVARALGHADELTRAPLRAALGLLLLALLLAPLSAHAPGWVRAALLDAQGRITRLSR